MLFTPHSTKQEEALFATEDNPEVKLVLCATGIQWGKTTVGSLWLKMQCHKYRSPDDNFIITSPTYPILQQSTLPPFLRAMEGLGKFHPGDMYFQIYNGGKVWFRTGTKPDSIVGMTNVRAILGDEAGLYSLYFWENIQGRAGFLDAPIFLVTSPYSLNWVWKDLIKPKRRDPSALPEARIFQATSLENLYFNRHAYEKRKRTMDPRRFKMMFGGEFDKMDGLVYDCWNDDCLVAPFTLPERTRFVGGIDFGTTNPFVLTVRAILPNGEHYQVSEHYKSGLRITEMVDIAKAKAKIWGIEYFWCDPSAIALILELNKAGLRAMAADNTIEAGIDRHYQLIKSGRYKIFAGTSPHTVDEYESYHYPAPDEMKVDKDIKEKNPVKVNDHAMDTNRYITIMECMVDGPRRSVIIPGETSDPIRRAQKRRRIGRGDQFSERFSA